MTRRQKSYDVKTFLSKKTEKKSFVSFVFTGVTMLRFVYSVFLCILPLTFILLSVGSLKDISGMGVSHVLPFFATINREKIQFPAAEKIVLHRGVSSLFHFDNKKEIKELPTQPKVNIEEKTVVSSGLNIKNETDYKIDIPNILSEDIVLSSSNPKVLIVHTHGSESYTPSEKYKYNASGNYRTQDTKYNMIRIGEQLAETLRKNGVEVIHDKTINDYPSYNDSYNKTQKLIEKHLASDSDISFVFDVHRDAVGEGDSIVKFVSEIHGKKTAQVMMVLGTDTNLPNPKWRKNLALALHIQNELELNYPGFMRPLNLRKERFNMHLTTGSILFEIGTNGNTLDEAIAAADCLGNGLAKIIMDIK